MARKGKKKSQSTLHSFRFGYNESNIVIIDDKVKLGLVITEKLMVQLGLEVPFNSLDCFFGEISPFAFTMSFNVVCKNFVFKSSPSSSVEAFLRATRTPPHIFQLFSKLGKALQVENLLRYGAFDIMWSQKKVGYELMWIAWDRTSIQLTQGMGIRSAIWASVAKNSKGHTFGLSNLARMISRVGTTPLSQQNILINPLSAFAAQLSLDVSFDHFPNVLSTF
ncbi:Endoplasmic reticulum vesicle transporter protein [Corchorus olitorius]|uniref:Endoplasmic reticulum vesicle transporter protein n=1 Tax=Corchorus olitorius TaxID=93759 RepID=A0A1R3HME2_9ROSI|nr:Endoplasmic reticulum vesicle transporter protein [Corchorus olitorius]